MTQEDLEYKVNDLFRYKIGDRLQHRGCWWQGQAESIYFNDTRCCMVVVNRHIEQCPTSVQMGYDCRMVSKDGHVTDRLFRMNEAELEPFVEKVEKP